MAATAESTRVGCEHLGAMATDVWRRATQVTQDVGALTTAAKDAIDEGKEFAVRGVARGVESVRRSARDLKHLPEDVASHVRHEPLRSMGLAVGVGLVAGCVCGWLVTRATRTAA